MGAGSRAVLCVVRYPWGVDLQAVLMNACGGFEGLLTTSDCFICKLGLALVKEVSEPIEDRKRVRKGCELLSHIPIKNTGAGIAHQASYAWRKLRDASHSGFED